jgi:phosphoribosylformylglycinamidine synthase
LSLLHSARDVSDGGLAVTLAESSIVSGIGASIDIVDEITPNPPPPGPPWELLFCEPSSAVVVTCDRADLPQIVALAAELEIFVQKIGETGGASLDFSVEHQNVFSIPVHELRESWSGALESALYDEVTA